MTAYVDPCIWKKSANARKTYSHLVADSLDELHEFAKQIGVKVHFFHKASAGWHYDINKAQFETAISAGASLITSRELLAKAKNLTPNK